MIEWIYKQTLNETEKGMITDRTENDLKHISICLNNTEEFTINIYKYIARTNTIFISLDFLEIKNIQMLNKSEIELLETIKMLDNKDIKIILSSTLDKPQLINNFNELIKNNNSKNYLKEMF